MKTCWCALCTLWLNYAVYGQTLAEWSFENVSSSIASLPIKASYTASNCSGANANLYGGNNVGTPAVCSGQNAWATNFWPISDTYSGGDCLEFTLTAKTMDLFIEDFSFSSSLSSSSGPGSYVVSYYTSSGDFGLISTGGFGAGGCSSDGASCGIILPKGASVALCIHPYGQDPRAMAATLRIDDVKITGAQFLPIALIDFNAVEEIDGTILLQWQTATEINVAHVAIERSIDGKVFQEIGRIEAQVDSYIPRSHRFRDLYPQATCNYYRLKIFDQDATEALSEIRAVCLQKGIQFVVKAYPNPTSDKLHLILPADLEQVQLLLIDLRGKNWPVKRSGNQLDLAELPTGMYFLHWKAKFGSGILKIIKD